MKHILRIFAYCLFVCMSVQHKIFFIGVFRLILWMKIPVRESADTLLSTGFFHFNA